jgi:hypothetical protein
MMNKSSAIPQIPTKSEDAVIESRPVAIFVFIHRHSNQSARSHQSDITNISLFIPDGLEKKWNELLRNFT